jgi:hypothetical protein
MTFLSILIVFGGLVNNALDTQTMVSKVGALHDLEWAATEEIIELDTVSWPITICKPSNSSCKTCSMIRILICLKKATIFVQLKRGKSKYHSIRPFERAISKMKAICEAQRVEGGPISWT